MILVFWIFSDLPIFADFFSLISISIIITFVVRPCVKGARIWNYSGPHFPAFGLNTERYSVSLRIQSECGKIRTRITPNTDTFHAVRYTKYDIYVVIMDTFEQVIEICLCNWKLNQACFWIWGWAAYNDWLKTSLIYLESSLTLFKRFFWFFI